MRTIILGNSAIDEQSSLDKTLQRELLLPSQAAYDDQKSLFAIVGISPFQGTYYPVLLWIKEATKKRDAPHAVYELETIALFTVSSEGYLWTNGYLHGMMSQHDGFLYTQLGNKRVGRWLSEDISHPRGPERFLVGQKVDAEELVYRTYDFSFVNEPLASPDPCLLEFGMFLKLVMTTYLQHQGKCRKDRLPFGVEGKEFFRGFLEHEFSLDEIAEKFSVIDRVPQPLQWLEKVDFPYP